MGQSTNHVVQDGIIAAAADHDRSPRTVEHVSHKRVAAIAVIEVDSHRIHVVGIAAAEVVNVVVPQNIALTRPVPAGVESTSIACFHHHAIDFVPLEKMFVTAV